jgi:hypothetical protein
LFVAPVDGAVATYIATIASFDASGNATAAVVANALTSADIGSTVQAYSANLDAWSAVAPSGYLTTDSAASAYLTIATAASTYLTSATAASTYLTTAAAAAGYQALDGDLTALAANSTNGLWARTGSGAGSARTLTGTSGKITITDGDGVAGNPTFNVGSDVALLNAADQSVTGGARVTSLSLGTITTGTLTLDPGDRPLQHYTNNGAHTLAPGSNTGSIILDITNGASAGAITTSGWTKVTGDAFTTTNAHKFRCFCSIGDTGSLLVVQAMQ